MQKFRLFQRKNNEKRQQDKQTSSEKRASDFFLGLLGLCVLFLVMIGVPFFIIMTLLTLSGLPTSYAVMIAGFLFLIMAVIALFKLFKKKKSLSAKEVPSRYPPMFHKQNNLSERAPSVSQKPIVTHEDKSDTAAKNILLGEEYKLNLPKTLFRWSDNSSDRPGDNVYQHWEDVILDKDGRLIIEENSITYSAHSIGHNTGRDTTTKPLSFDQLPKMIALAEDKNAQKYLGMNEQNWPKYVRVRKTNEELASELETVVTLDLDYSNWVELRLHKTTGRAYTVKGENVQHGGALIPSITSIKRAFLSEVSSMVAKEYDYAKAFKLLYPKWEEHLCRKVLVISDSRYRMGWFAVVDGVEIPREAIGFGETVFHVPAQLLTEDQHKKYAAYHTQTGPYEHYFDLPAECCEKVIRKLVPLASEKMN